MKKIIFITENLYGGGVQRILQIICKHFDYSNYEITLYTVREDNPDYIIFPSNITFKYIFDTIKPGQTSLQKFYINIKNKIKLLVYYHLSPRFFYKLFINEKTDVAIAFIEGYATRLVSGFPNNIRKIAWLHTDIINNHWSKIAYKNIIDEKKAYETMEQIVCVADTVKRQFDKTFNLTNKSIIIHNPIDSEYIKNLSSEMTGKYDNDRNNCHILITIGALIDVKGYHRLLNIAKRLMYENLNFKLWIIGEGYKHKEFELFIQENKLSSHVKLLGFQTNPYKYIKAADIYVCSSYAEGYNTAITEALVLGKPVVSTECSGVKEQLGENNEYGICTPNTEEGLYEGIKQMLDEKTLNLYTQKAKERGKDFTLEASMNKIYQLIES